MGSAPVTLDLSKAVPNGDTPAASDVSLDMSAAIPLPKANAPAGAQPTATIGPAPTWGENLSSLIHHPLNALEAASQPVSRPHNATVPEMINADLRNVEAGAAGVIRHPLNTIGGIVKTAARVPMIPVDTARGKPNVLQQTYQQANENGPQTGAMALGQGVALGAAAEGAAGGWEGLKAARAARLRGAPPVSSGATPNIDNMEALDSLARAGKDSLIEGKGTSASSVVLDQSTAVPLPKPAVPEQAAPNPAPTSLPANLQAAQDALTGKPLRPLPTAEDIAAGLREPAPQPGVEIHAGPKPVPEQAAPQAEPQTAAAQSETPLLDALVERMQSKVEGKTPDEISTLRDAVDETGRRAHDAGDTRGAEQAADEHAALSKLLEDAVANTERSKGGESRPVVQGSNKPDQIQQSAQEQKPAMQQAATAAVAGVPGAKVEGVRVKDAESVDNKDERGKPPETITDHLGGRVSAPTPEAVAQVKQNIEQNLPVVGKDQIDNNGLKATQYAVQTGKPGEANQQSELQVVTTDQAKAMKDTDPLYDKQKEALARGDQAEADRLGAQIKEKFDAAAQPESKSKSPKATVDAYRRQFPNTKLTDEEIARDAPNNQKQKEVTVADLYEKHPDLAHDLASRDPEIKEVLDAIIAKTASKENSDAHTSGHNRPASEGPKNEPQGTNGPVRAPETGGAGRSGEAGSEPSVRAGSPEQPAGTGGAGPNQPAAVTPEPAKGTRIQLKDGRKGTVEWYDRAKKQARVRRDDGKMMPVVPRDGFTAIPSNDVAKHEVSPEAKGDKWIGVDLDGTLAQYDGFKGPTVIGEPIPAMVARVKQWIADGNNVNILTARVNEDKDGKTREAIQDWTEKHLGKRLEVTDVKDHHMVALYDDRAVSVERNTGALLAQPQAEGEHAQSGNGGGPSAAAKTKGEGGETDAVRQQQPAEVLQRQPEEDRGGNRGRVQPEQQGNGPAGESAKPAAGKEERPLGGENGEQGQKAHAADEVEKPKVKPKNWREAARAKKEAQESEDRNKLLAEHFVPGNVILSDYWKEYDKVLEFRPTTPEHGWEVKVIKSDKDGNPIPGERPRLHATYPDKRDKIVKHGEPEEKEHKYKFGNTQHNISPDSDAAKALDEVRASIPEADLAGDGKDIDGNHVTVRYGIQREDTAGIKAFIEQQAPFDATLGPVAKFPPSEHSDGAAPLIAPVESPDLHKLNAEIEKHGDFTEPSFPEYKPHATVAYVKPEAADKYVGDTTTEGAKFRVDSIDITDRDGNAETVKLKGKQEDDELRESLGVSRAALDAYDPARAVRKMGSGWWLTDINGKDYPSPFDTKAKAVEMGEQHKSLKEAQFENPSDYRDIISVRASKRLVLIEKYQRQGMTEIEAAQRARREIPESAAAEPKSAAKPRHWAGTVKAKKAKAEEKSPEQVAIEQHRAAHVPGTFAQLVTEHGKWADKLVRLLKDPKAYPNELAEAAAKVDELAPRMEQETGNAGGPVWAEDFGYKKPTKPEPPSDLNTFYTGFLDPALFKRLFPDITARTALWASDTVTPADEQRAMMRETRGQMDRRVAIAIFKLRDAAKEWRARPRAQSIEFWNAVENGRIATLSPKDQALAQVFKAAFDQMKGDIQKLKPEALQNYIENYFPHIWENPTQARKAITGVLTGKKPLAGKGGFLKRRTIPTMQDGLDMGFTPRSWNPVDLFVLKYAEMAQFLMGHQTLEVMKEAGTAKFVRIGQKASDGWKQLDDKISAVHRRVKVLDDDKLDDVTQPLTWPGGKRQIPGAFSEDIEDATHGELALVGHYYAPADAARIFNNFVSRGIAGRSSAYDTLRWLNDNLNGLQLGISAFHATVTTVNAAASDIALGIEQLMQGKPVKAGASMVSGAAILPTLFRIIRNGSKLMREYLSPGSHAKMAKEAEAMGVAGGRITQNTTDSTAGAGFVESIIAPFDKAINAFRNGAFMEGLSSVPGAILQGLTAPVLTYYVPRVKVGAFYYMAHNILEEAQRKNWTSELIRTRMQEAWDSIDDRFGQVVYENLFWPKVLTDALHLTVRAVGYTYGDIRTYGGAAADTAKAAVQIGRGKKPRVTPRMAFAVGSFLSTALLGGVMTFLWTGHPPQMWKDYTHPRDTAGQRHTIPGYPDQMISAAHDPVQWVLNKQAPIWTAFGEMARNQDYDRTEIRHKDDPAVQQLAEVAEWAGKQAIPFSFTNTAKLLEQRGALPTLESMLHEAGKHPGDLALGQLGFQSAPAFIQNSAALNKAREYVRENAPPGTKTKEQADKTRAMHAVEDMYRTGEVDQATIQELRREHMISQADVLKARLHAKQDPLVRLAKSLSPDQALHVWNLADEKERKELRPTIELKSREIQTKITDPAKRNDLHRQYREALRGKPIQLRPGSA